MFSPSLQAPHVRLAGAVLALALFALLILVSVAQAQEITGGTQREVLDALDLRCGQTEKRYLDQVCEKDGYDRCVIDGLNLACHPEHTYSSLETTYFSWFDSIPGYAQCILPKINKYVACTEACQARWAAATTKEQRTAIGGGGRGPSCSSACVEVLDEDATDCRDQYCYTLCREGNAATGAWDPQLKHEVDARSQCRCSGEAPREESQPAPSAPMEEGPVVPLSDVLTGSGPSEPGNNPPRIESLGYQPDPPMDDASVVLTVKVTDDDGDLLGYRWQIDEIYYPDATTASVTWRVPSPGPHTVTVEVHDGRGGSAKASVELMVLESGQGPDRDEDGTPDREDRCPDEWGLEEDGCPAFAVAVGCVPAAPAEGDRVVCSAKPAGVHPGEAMTYDWYLDSSPVASAAGPAWTWSSAEGGSHEVRVVAQGDMREAEALRTLEVGPTPELAVAVGLLPDPPVAGRTVFLSASVQGTLSVETDKLTYAWSVDGQPLGCDGSTCDWTGEAGPHSVEVIASSPETGRSVTGGRNFELILPGPGVDDQAAGFGLSVSCPTSVSSDGELVCTASLTLPQQTDRLYQIAWYVDGAAAAADSTLGDPVTWALAQPAPGQHTVEARATDTQTGRSRVAGAFVTVSPGRNATVPAASQAAAAVATTSVLGAWLWLEWWMSQRAAAAAAEQEARAAAEEAERLRQRQEFEAWADEQQAAREQKLKSEGYVYKAGEDEWSLERQSLRDRRFKAFEAFSQVADRLPPDQRAMLQTQVDKAIDWDNPTEQDLITLARIRRRAFDAAQRQQAEAYQEAMANAKRWGHYETGAKVIGVLSAIYSLPVTVGAILVHGATGAAIAGVTGLGGRIVEGLGVGYTEGGVKGAATQVIKNTLPVNTVIAAYKGLRGDKDVEWYDPLIGVVQDGLNLLNTAGGIWGIKHLRTPSLPLAQRVRLDAAARLASGADDVPKAITGVVKPLSSGLTLGQRVRADAAARLLAKDMDVPQALTGTVKPLESVPRLNQSAARAAQRAVGGEPQVQRIAQAVSTGAGDEAVRPGASSPGVGSQGRDAIAGAADEAAEAGKTLPRGAARQAAAARSPEVLRELENIEGKVADLAHRRHLLKELRDLEKKLGDAYDVYSRALPQSHDYDKARSLQNHYEHVLAEYKAKYPNPNWVQQEEIADVENTIRELTEDMQNIDEYLKPQQQAWYGKPSAEVTGDDVTKKMEDFIAEHVGTTPSGQNGYARYKELINDRSINDGTGSLGRQIRELDHRIADLRGKAVPLQRQLEFGDVAAKKTGFDPKAPPPPSAVPPAASAANKTSPGP